MVIAALVQGDAFNRSSIATVVCVPITSNLKWAGAPGNVELRPRDSGLAKPSVANVSQITTVDRDALVERVGSVSGAKVDLILRGIDVGLDRVR